MNTSPYLLVCATCIYLTELDKTMKSQEGNSFESFGAHRLAILDTLSGEPKKLIYYSLCSGDGNWIHFSVPEAFGDRDTSYLLEAYVSI
jgi:hypothetical protein